MKKSIYLMAGLIGFALTSCEDTSDLGIMQQNPAPIVVPADGVAIQSNLKTTLNLNDYVNQQVPVIDIELSNSFSAEAVVTGEMQIASNSDFSDAFTLEITSMEAESPNKEAAAKAGGNTRSYVGVVDGNGWEDAFVGFYGLNPSSRENYIRYKLYLADDTQKNILQSPTGEEWWPAYQLTVEPVDAKLDIDSAYKLVYYIGSAENTIEMYHNPDMHIYDDPTFNVMIEVSEEDAEAGFSWTIISATTPSKVYGVSSEIDSFAGKGNLQLIADGGNKGTIVEPGSYKIEANMLEKTFTVMMAPKSLYVMSVSGVTFEDAAQLGTSDYITYSGMAGLLSAWGLTGQAAYKPTLYINDDSVEPTADGNTISGAMLYSTSGQPLTPTTAIPYPGKSAGLYYITANLQTLTYTGYKCDNIGITGSMNDWGATPDIMLKGSRTTFYMQWSGTVDLEEGQEWKIRANSDWVVNFGGAGSSEYATDGTPVQLEMNGSNFVAATSGQFNVTVYFKRVLGEDGKMTPYYMEVTPAK